MFCLGLSFRNKKKHVHDIFRPRRGIKLIHCFPFSCRFSDLLVPCEQARGARERRRQTGGAENQLHFFVSRVACPL
jgi:hypothetical protein